MRKTIFIIIITISVASLISGCSIDKSENIDNAVNSEEAPLADDSQITTITNEQPEQDSANIATEESTDESASTDDIAYESNSSYNGNFSIEGKWKQMTDIIFGQVSKGSIIVFDGTHCNIISPQDTYAFYKEGNKYSIDITPMLNPNHTYSVVIIDNDNIEIDDKLKLRRVE